MSMEYITTDLTLGQQIIALDAIIEPLEYHIENTPNEFMNWEDFTMQLADEIVPVWNHERAQWWLDMNMPESDDYSPGVGDGILDAITFSLYMAIERFLMEIVRSVMIDSDTEPTVAEVLGGAIEYRQQFGVAKAYANLANAILN
jgi:hypothetical protein